MATVKNFRGINRSRAPRIRGAFSLFIPRFLDLHHRRAQALRAGDESKKNARPTPQTANKLGLNYEEKPAKEHADYLAALGHASAPVVVDDAGNSFSGFRPDKLRQAA